MRHYINYLLTIPQHKVSRTSFPRLSPYGITPGQYGVLSCFWKNESITSKGIARAFRLENSTVPSILDRTQKQDLIDRVVGPDNRRSILVIATLLAMAMKDDVPRAVNKLNVEMLRDSTPQEKNALMESLRRTSRIDEEE